MKLPAQSTTAPVKPMNLILEEALAQAEAPPKSPFIPAPEPEPHVADPFDLVRPDSSPYADNPLYLGNIGAYEVWRGRAGFWVAQGEAPYPTEFKTPDEAIDYARNRYAKDQDELTRYLAIRTPPALARAAR
jgi:hypothetical protein